MGKINYDSPPKDIVFQFDSTGRFFDYLFELHKEVFGLPPDNTGSQRKGVLNEQNFNDSITQSNFLITTQLNLPADVTGLASGDIRYNTSNIALEYYDGVSWHDAGSPKYIYIKALTQSEGDLHLSATTWNTSKALISVIKVVTSSTDWDLYILQNDNGFTVDDANIPKMQIMANGNGNAEIFVNLPYEDEDNTKEVHLYYLDNSGANTADFYIIGYQLR